MEAVIRLTHTMTFVHRVHHHDRCRVYLPSDLLLLDPIEEEEEEEEEEEAQEDWRLGDAALDICKWFSQN